MYDYIIKRPGVILFVLLFIIIYFPIFLHLDYMPFCMWDESILGVNALKMIQNHNYLVTYFYETPDLYRCKPPLILWCIILSTKVLGFNELSLRLPSAIAASLLCIYLFFVLKRITGNYLFGFFTVCILITCQGYIGIHLIRTGDYDSLWILFTTIFSINLFLAVEANDKISQSRYLLAFFIFLTLGLLTKGVGCTLQQVPGLLIYVLIRKKLGILIKNKASYAGLAVFCVFGLGYYLLRESINPGYLKAVWQHEIVNQFGIAKVDPTLDGQIVSRFPYVYYIRRMLTYQFISYMFIFPIALYTGLKLMEPKPRKIISFAVLTGFSFFLVITLDSKKVPHYDGPLFPYIAIITASFFYVLYIYIDKQLRYKIRASWVSPAAFLFVLALLANPYYEIIKTVYFPKDKWEGWVSESGKFFQKAARGQVYIGQYKIVCNKNDTYGPATVLTCYEKELSEHGTNIRFAQPGQLVLDDKAIIFDDDSIDSQIINRNFTVDTLQHLDYCNADIIRVKGVKVKS